MNIDYLLLITEFNNKLKLRKLNIDDVVIKMNQIEDMFKLNYSMSMKIKYLLLLMENINLIVVCFYTLIIMIF